MPHVFYATHKDDAWEKYPPERWGELNFHRHISGENEPAAKGDVLLLYKFPASLPDAGICEIYELKKVASGDNEHWYDRLGRPDNDRPPAFGYFVMSMTLALRLATPITYAEMGSKSAIRTWGR